MEHPKILIDDRFDVLKVALSEAGGVIGNAHKYAYGTPRPRHGSSNVIL